MSDVESARKSGLIAYVLYLVGIFIPIAALVGVVVNHIKQKETEDQIWENNASVQHNYLEGLSELLKGHRKAKKVPSESGDLQYTQNDNLQTPPAALRKAKTTPIPVIDEKSPPKKPKQEARPLMLNPLFAMHQGSPPCKQPRPDIDSPAFSCFKLNQTPFDASLMSMSSRIGDYTSFGAATRGRLQSFDNEESQFIYKNLQPVTTQKIPEDTAQLATS